VRFMEIEGKINRISHIAGMPENDGIPKITHREKIKKTEEAMGEKVEEAERLLEEIKVISTEPPGDNTLMKEMKRKLLQDKWLWDFQSRDHFDLFREQLMSLEPFYRKIQKMKRDRIHPPLKKPIGTSKFDMMKMPGKNKMSPNLGVMMGLPSGGDDETKPDSSDTQEPDSSDTQEPASPDKPDVDKKEKEKKAEGDKNIRTDDRSKKAGMHKQEKVSKEDERKIKEHEKRVEIAGKIKEIEGKLKEIDRDIDNLEEKLLELEESNVEISDEVLEKIRAKLEKKKLEKERLKAEKEKERDRLTFSEVEGGGDIEEDVEQRVEAEKQALEKTKEKQYKIGETIKQNIEYIEDYPDDKRKADTLSDFTIEGENLESARDLEEFQESLREHKDVK